MFVDYLYIISVEMFTQILCLCVCVCVYDDEDGTQDIDFVHF
jgi:chemotaxis receptor (MCP) glutamine deamidase CheD